MRNEFRVVCGTGQHISYKTFNSEKNARDYAANELLRGAISSVVVERHGGDNWEKHRQLVVIFYGNEKVFNQPHKSQVAEDAVRQKGAWLLFLPPYSPDLNPVEMAFSKLKAHLRAKNAHHRSPLGAIGDICDLYKPAECANFFKVAGYAQT